MKYHIRVPFKAVAVFRTETLPENPIDQSKQLRQWFDEGKFILTCEQIFPDDRTIVQVCEDCGSELVPEEAEVGLCDECYKKAQKESSDEQRNPDEK